MGLCDDWPQIQLPIGTTNRPSLACCLLGQKQVQLSPYPSGTRVLATLRLQSLMAASIDWRATGKAELFCLDAASGKEVVAHQSRALI